MAVANIKNVVAVVLKSGKKRGTSCAFIERGTTNSERIVAGNLGNIIEKARKAAVKSPAVFIVGEVVNYGKKIQAKKFKTR